MRNKMIIGISALTLVLSNMIPVYAIDKASKKEEVVYAVLNSDGSVDGGYVVNVMYSEDGQIVDYGNYSEVKNLTTTDELTYKDGKITASTSSDKLYYEGYLKEIELPWNIDIQYYLDNNSISANDLAGASGHLKIVINITENDNANEIFFDNFALQASMTLNTNLCFNIVAEGATIANVGENKQLTYTILPDSEKEIVVESDVTDFEMDAIAINGVQLDLGIDIDNMDTSELNNKIDEIIDAVSDLNEGAEELNEGTNELNDGVNELTDGTKQVNDGANALVEGSTALNEGTLTVNSGASSLSQGANELVSGIEQIQTGLITLNSQSESLTSGSNEVKEALSTINSSLENVNINSDDLSNLIEASTQLQSGIDNLVTYLETIDSTISSYESQVGLLSDIQSSTTDAISQLEYLASIDTENATLYQQLIQLLQAGYASEQILQGLQSNNSTALSGALQLQSSYTEFNNNITELVNSLSVLIENMSKLKAGIQQLVDNYDSLDNGINDYTEAVAQIVDGYNQIYSASQTLANGANDLYSGTQSLVNGSESLLDGSETLADGTNSLLDGAESLAEGSHSLTDGSAELYEGASIFYEEVNDIDITDSIQDVIDDLMGSDYEPTSFVDEQNTDVEMVQFIIKTNAIEKEEENEMEEIIDEKSIWQKILSFFGLDN